MPSEVIEQIGQKSARAVPPWRIVRWLIQLGIGTVILWWIVRWGNIDFEQLWTAFRKASALDLALAVVFFVISIVLKTIQFRICLSLPVSNRYLFGLFLSQNAFLTILPWRVGEISLPLLLWRNRDVPVATSVSSVIIIRLIDLIVIGAVVAVSGARLGIFVSLGILASCIIILGSALYFVKVISQRRSSPKFLRAISVAFESLSNLVTLGWIVLLSAGVFFTTTLQSAFALRALGLAIPLLEIAILNAATLIVAVLPLHPPGGWGTIDLIQVMLLRQLNFSPEITTPVILVTHCFYTFLVLLGGVVGWWICRNISRR
jgi:uncharacterized membrane protein YbhN (UPF0104 family)